MNQPRAQRYLLAILALGGLFIGSNLGAFADQFTGAAMDTEVVLAYRACTTCFGPVLDFAAEAIKVNRWLLTGAVFGLLLGLVAAWVVRLVRPATADGPKRLSSFRQSAEVARFSQDVGTTLEMQGILDQLHEEVLSVTNADCGSSFLFDLNSPEHRVTLRVGEAADIHRLSAAEAAIVASGSSQVVKDFDVEKLPPPHVGIRSALLVPITHEENTLGLIHLHSQEAGKFNAEFHDLVQALAAQAAVALLNAQRFDEQLRRTEALRQRVNQLQQLVQSPALVRVDRPLPDNLEAVAGAMLELADFRLVVVSVYVASTNQLRHAVARGNVPAGFDRTLQPVIAWERVQPYLREEHRSSRAFLVPHTQTPELLRALELGHTPARPEPRVAGQWHADDILLLPLYAARGDIQGLLAVGAPRDLATPQNLVLELVEFFAGQAALAIENAQLLAEAESRVGESQERAATLTALAEASGLIGATLRVDEVATLTLDQLRRVIAFDAVTFWRRDPADGNWHVAGSRSYQEALERVVARMEQVKGALFSEITATRSVIVISDVTRDVRFQMRETSGLRSWLGVPLLSQGEVIGILSLEKGEDNFYSATHVPLALAFASRAAVALENARQYEESVTRARELEEENARRLQELEVRTQRLALLNRIAGELNAAVDLDGLLRLTLAALAEPLAVERASALVFDPDGPRDEAFVMAAARHPAGGAGGVGLALADNALLERLEEGGLPLLVEPERLAADSPVRPEHLAWIGAEVRAAVFLPLLAQGRLMGVVGLGYAGARRFAGGDVELGFAVAQQAVTAIQNVQLRHKTREQAITSQLARSISRAADIPALWEVVRTQLGALVSVHSFSVALYDDTRNEVAFPLIVERGERLDGAAAAASGLAPSGLVRHILGTRQPLLLAGGADQHAQLLAAPGQHPVRGKWEGPAPALAKAYLGLPLVLGERLLGVLIAEDAERENAFNDSHERVLSAAASQIAVTLDNLRLYGQAQSAAAASHERAAQLEALADVSLALATTLRTDEVIRQALDQLQRVLPHAAVTFWHKVAGSGQRQSAARWRAAGVRGDADTPERLNQTIALEPGTALAEIAAGRGVLVVADTAVDPRFTGPSRSWLGLRVLSQGATIGLLEIESAGPGAYHTSHGPLVQAFAARLALALNEARQYEESLARAQELDAQARRLTLLNRAAAELSGSLDLDKLLQTTLRLLADAVGIRRAGAVVYEDGRPTPLAAVGHPAQTGAGDARGQARALWGNPLLPRLRHLAGVEAIEDVAAEQTIVPDHLSWMGGGAQSVTFLPLAAEGQTLGWLALGFREAHKSLTPAELELAQAIAMLAAGAVHNARAYYRADLHQREQFEQMQHQLQEQVEATQQRLSEQATINQIGRALSQAIDPASLSEILRAQLDAWLAPRGMQLALYDESANEVSLPLTVEAGESRTLSPRAPEGMLRYLLQTQQPLLLTGDVPAQLRELNLEPDALGETTQYMAAPLRLGEKLLGVLAVNGAATALSDSHQRVLNAVAAQVAVTVENARLYADNLRRIRDLEDENTRRGMQLTEQATFQQLSRGLSRALDLKLVWDSLRVQLEAWLAPRHLQVALYDEGRHEASFPLAVVDGRLQTLSPRAPEGVLRHVLQSQQPLLLAGAVREQLAALNLPADAVGQAESFLAVPLRAADRVLGVLSVGDPADGTPLTETHQRLLLALADQLAPVVDNARLHLQARQSLLSAQARAGQMALVTEAAEAIGAAFRFDDVVDAALLQLKRLLPYARATFWQATGNDSSTQEVEPLRWQPIATRGAAGAEAVPLPPTLVEDLTSLRLPVLLAAAGTAGLMGAASEEARRAWIGVPLVSQEEIIGAIVMESADGQVYSPDDLPALDRLARTTAVALESARRYETALRHSRDWEARAGVLQHLGIELNAALELERLLPVQLRLLATTMGADSAGVLIFDEQTASTDPTQPRVLAHARYPVAEAALPPAAGAQALAGSLLAEWLTHAETPLAITDLGTNRLLNAAQVAWVGEGLKAALFLPLIDAGRPIGLVGLGYLAARRAFAPTEVDLGQVLAAQAAPVVKNALVYEAARKQLDEQALLQQVLRAVSRAADVWQLSEAVHSRLAAWLGADSLYLALYDEERDTVVFPVLVESGSLREVAPLTPGGVLRHVLQNRHALRLSGDVALQARELGLPLAGVPQRPLRWSGEASELLLAQSYLAVPILHGESVVGVLAAEALENPDAFDTHHERLLATIAAQVAVMLENTRLYRETREALAAAQARVGQLETLTAALGDIATVLYSEDVVGVALAQFRRVIPCDEIVYWQREPGAGRELRWRRAGAAGDAGDAHTAEHAAGSAPDAVRQALFAEIVSSRRALVVADTSRDARFGAGAATGAAHAWLIAPLLNKGDVMGLLALDRAAPNAYHTGHAPVAQVLANQVAAVLVNAAEFEQSLQRVLELDERGRRLTFLNRFAAEVGSGLDMRGTLQMTLRALAETLGIEQATAAVFDDTAGTVLALEHFPETKSAQALLAGFSLSGNFLRDRLQDAHTPIAVEDVTALEPSSRFRQSDWIGRNVKSAMFLPLTQGEKLIGVVGLGQSEAGRRFTSNEMELAMALANQAATAVQNVVLYERVQLRLAEQATINQVNRALGRALDLNHLFAVVRAQLQDWVGPERLVLGVYDAPRNEVSFPLALEGGQPVIITPRAPAGLVRHLLQNTGPTRLNGEVAQQLKDQGLFVSGLGPSVGLDDFATVTACLGVSLSAGEKVVGLLLLASPARTEAFDDSHERILSALAPQIAVSLETTQQYDQARQASAAAQARTAQLTALTEATSTVASALRTDQVIGLTLDQLQRVLPYDRVTFWRRAGTNGLWKVTAARRASAAQQGYVEAPERLGQTSELNAPQHDPLAEVYTTRSLMAVPDTSQDPRFGGNGDRPGSWLGVPLLHKGEVQGLLALEKAEANTYTAGLIPLAQVFANQAAVALANVGLYEDSLQRAYELDERAALVNRVSDALSASVDPDEILGIALQALAEAVPLDLATVIVFDEARPSGRARATAHYPANRPAPAGGLPLTSNLLLNQLRESLRPVAVQSVATESLLQADHYEWVGTGLQAALFLPLVMARGLIGVIGLGQVTASRGFTTAEINLAMSLANQTAVAVHNARLYRQTQRRLMELAHISQTGRTIGQTVDVRQLYDTVRSQVEVGLRADSLYLALYDASRDEVSYPVLVSEGKAIQVTAQKPDPLVRHILDTGQSLLLTGGVEAKLAEMGLWPRGSTNAPPPTLPVQAKAYLGVPLLLGNRVAGVLAVQDYKRTYGLTEKHERSLVSIAAPIAAAVDGARMYEESAQRALALDARSALLGRMAAELGDMADLPRALSFIAQVLTETLVADVGAAIVFDDLSENVRALAAARFPAVGEGVATNFLTESPLAPRLLSTLTPVTLDDLTTEPEERRVFTAWLAEGVQSALFVPLLTGERLVGLVVVASLHQARPFTAGEVELAQTVASQAAVAVANVRQQEQMQPRLLALATISRISQAIGDAATIEQLTQTLMTHLAPALEAETLYLALYDEAHGQFSFPLLSVGGELLTAGAQAPAGQLAYLLTKRDPLLLNGQVAEQLQRLDSSYVPVHPSLATPQSLVAAPLFVNRRLVGVLAAEDRFDPGRFSPTHEGILSTISGPIGVTLENLRLLAEQAQRSRLLAERSQQLALLNRVSAALIGQLTAPQILTVALRELASALKADQAGAFYQAGADAQHVMRLPDTNTAHEATETAAALLEQLRQVGGSIVVPEPAPERFGWLAAGLKAALCLPLWQGKTVVGAVVLGQTAPRKYAAEDLALAETLVNAAALALENTRRLALWEETQAAGTAQAAQLTTLAAIANQITLAQRVDDVIQQTLEHSPRLLPYDSLFFWRWDAAEAGPGELQLLGLRGSAAADHQVGEPLSLARGDLLADVVSQRSAIVSASPSEAEDAWLGVPLLYRDDLLGVLAFNHAQAGTYTPERVMLAQSLAGFVAAAYANARQYEFTLQQGRRLDGEAQRLALLNRVQRDVFRTLDLHAVLPRLLKEVGEAVNAEQAGAAVFGPESGSPAFVAQYPALNPAATVALDGNPLIERLRQSLAPLVIADAAAEVIPAAHTAWVGPGVRALLLLPMVVEEQWLGVVGLARHSTATPFTEQEVALAHNLVRAVATGVQNAQKQAALEASLAGVAQQLETQTADLAELQATYAAGQQHAQVTEQALQARTTELNAINARYAESIALLREIEQQLESRQASLTQLRAHARELARVKLAGPPAVEALLGQELLLASQALRADSAALFLTDAEAGAARLHTAHALDEASSPIGQQALIGAALQQRETLIIGDLNADARWTGRSAEPAADAEATLAAPPPGGYQSAMVIPLLVDDAPVGGLLFLSQRPAAFEPGQLALASAAAAQVSFTLQGAALNAAWRAQAGPLTGWLAESEPESTAVLRAAVDATLTRVNVPPASTTAAVREPAAPLKPVVVPVPVGSHAHTVPAPEPERVTAAAAPGWRRRLTMPVVAVALTICVLGALAVSAQPLGRALGLFGAATTPTQAVVPTSLLVNTAAPTAGVENTAIVEPTAVNTEPAATTVAPAATETVAATATPAPTDTPAPTLSPTPGLPPGVTALATVTLSEGIAGRLRDAPNGTVIGGVPGNTQVQVLRGRTTTDDGIVWVEINVIETGETGWFAESLLSYDTPPRA